MNKFTYDPSIYDNKHTVVEQLEVTKKLIKDVAESAVTDAADLENLMEGSETVIVDMNEANDKIEIHLDADVVSTLQRAVTIPVAGSSVAQIPVLGTDRAIYWEPVESFGGDKIYKHTLKFQKNEGTFNEMAPVAGVVVVYSRLSRALTNAEAATAIAGQVMRYITGFEVIDFCDAGIISFCSYDHSNTVFYAQIYGNGSGGSSLYFDNNVVDVVTEF